MHPVETAVGQPSAKDVPGALATGLEGVERGHGRAVPIRIDRDILHPAVELGRSPPVGRGGEKPAELDLGVDSRPRLPEELEHCGVLRRTSPVDDERGVRSISPESADAEFGGGESQASAGSPVPGATRCDRPPDEAAMEARHGPAAEGERGDRRGQCRLGSSVESGERIDRDDEHRVAAGDERDGERPRPRHLQQIDDTDSLRAAVLAGKPARAAEPWPDLGREVGKRPGSVVVGVSGHSRGPP